METLSGSSVDINLNLARLAYPIRSLGPGPRVALWVAGCRRNCPGCVSPELQSPTAGRLMPVQWPLWRLGSLDIPLRGLTISGGEPLDQAPALAALLQEVKNLRPAWDIIVYSGYTRREIEDLGFEAARVLELTDLLIDGPFNSGTPPAHPLAGSGNQVAHPLTERGKILMADADPVRAAFDLGLGPAGQTFLIGVGSPAERASIARIWNVDQKPSEPAGPREPI